jgi:hypothetical protein
MAEAGRLRIILLAVLQILPDLTQRSLFPFPAALVKNGKGVF